MERSQTIKDFESFVRKKRKTNGEKYTEKSIQKYVRIIELNEDVLCNVKDENEMIAVCNSIIRRVPHLNTKASLKLFLQFISYDDKFIKKLDSPQRRASALTSERHLMEKVIPKKDIDFLFENLSGETLLIFRILYDTALRENEFLGLRKRDVEILYDGKIGAEINTVGKGGKRRRVFLSNTTTKLFEDLKSDYKPNDKLFIFKKQNGEPKTRQDLAVYGLVTKTTKELLGKEYSVHSFRHSKLSHIAEKTDILGVSSYASHSSLATTNVYVKASAKMGRQAFLEGEKK